MRARVRADLVAVREEVFDLCNAHYVRKPVVRSLPSYHVKRRLESCARKFRKRVGVLRIQIVVKAKSHGSCRKDISAGDCFCAERRRVNRQRAVCFDEMKYRDAGYAGRDGEVS